MQNMFDRLGLTVLSVCFKQVRHMQKTRSFETNIHKSTLHTRQDPHHSSEVNIAHQASSNNTLYKDILYLSIYNNCNAGLSRSRIYQNGIHITQKAVLQEISLSFHTGMANIASLLSLAIQEIFLKNANTRVHLEKKETPTASETQQNEA